jgi:ketosteroid isomerase-like protein
MTKLSIGLAVLMMASASLAPAQQASDPKLAGLRAAIDSGNAEYIRGFGAGDAAQVAAAYAPDGGRFSGGGHIARGTSAIRADVAKLIHEVGPITVTLTTLDVWLMDDRAYETGKWTYAWAKKGGGLTTIGGRYVTIWGRQSNGRWRIVADVGVPD